MKNLIANLGVKWYYNTFIIVFLILSTQNASAAIPNAPTNLTATAVSLNQINLVWRDNATDESSYEVEYLSGTNWVKLKSILLTDIGIGEYNNTYSHTGINPGSRFIYRVYAQNASGNSAYSNESQANTPESKGVGARYETKGFTATLTSNIEFGTAPNGTVLKLDLYEPTADTSTNRPLVIFIHGGGFFGGDKVDTWNTILCTNLAERGYVVASINYRLTPQAEQLLSLANNYKAMIKAVQDAKAAIRFFRKNETVYKIDSSQIFATGSSAGSMTALHLGYLEQSEVPAAYVPDWTLCDGSLEGNSGNPGYSTAINGVMSNWGAIAELDYIKQGDVPLFCVHGTVDTTVPYDKTPAYFSMNYGSKPIVENALDKWIRASYKLFYANHTLRTVTTNAVPSQLTLQNQAADAIGSWLCTVLKIYTESLSSKDFSKKKVKKS
jgi:predicted esterase